MNKRAHIPYPQQLAAALRELGGIPYEHAKLMSAEQVISLFHRDHGILHATNPINEHWNITWTLIRPHREKSKRDTAIVAKSKRIRRKQDDHWKNMSFTQSTAEEPSGSIRYKRRIPSRPFPKIKRPIRSNKRANKLHP